MSSSTTSRMDRRSRPTACLECYKVVLLSTQMFPALHQQISSLVAYSPETWTNDDQHSCIACPVSRLPGRPCQHSTAAFNLLLLLLQSTSNHASWFHAHMGEIGALLVEFIARLSGWHTIHQKRCPWFICITHYTVVIKDKKKKLPSTASSPIWFFILYLI
jgi:hypothetical protein